MSSVLILQRQNLCEQLQRVLTTSQMPNQQCPNNGGFDCLTKMRSEVYSETHSQTGFTAVWFTLTLMKMCKSRITSTNHNGDWQWQHSSDCKDSIVVTENIHTAEVQLLTIAATYTDIIYRTLSVTCVTYYTWRSNVNRGILKQVHRIKISRKTVNAERVADEKE